MLNAKSLLWGATFFVAASCLSTASQATNVLSDNFNTENGGAGATALQYTGFANWNVTGTGVDLVHTGDFQITCPGSCVDLDGTPGPGGLASKQFFAFNAGDVVTLSFDMSGSQRGGSGVDFFTAGFNFSSSTSINDFTLGGAYAFGDDGNFSNLPGIDADTTTTSNSFSTYILSFTAVNSGSVQIAFATNEPGNVGPLLDNVSLDISGAGGGVPEPATWAMLLLGMFGMGAMVRFARQRLAVA